MFFMVLFVYLFVISSLRSRQNAFGVRNSLRSCQVLALLASIGYRRQVFAALMSGAHFVRAIQNIFFP
jgi:hypothetical protein